MRHSEPTNVRNPSISQETKEKARSEKNFRRSHNKQGAVTPARLTPPVTSPAHYRGRRTTKTIPWVPLGTIIQGKYELQNVIGTGGYGQVFKAFDSNRKIYVAVKMQKSHDPRRVILEQHILRLLKGKPEFPKLFGSGTFEKYMYIVMELLGKSLSELRKKNTGKRFDTVTALRVGFMMTDTLKILHDMGYLHRDIKPGNMCVGATPVSIRRVHLLDFGLARKFKENGKVRRRRKVRFRGTLRYVSLNVHERRDQCPCDDLISNFYTMVELAEGNLPWTGLRDVEDIARRKRNVSFKDLCPFSGMPTELQEYYKYCHDNVEDPNQPNYAYLKDIIKKGLPVGFDFGSPMPWESMSSSSESFTQSSSLTEVTCIEGEPGP